MQKDCATLTTKLESLKQLKTGFDLELSSLPQTGKTGDLVSIRELKLKLQHNLKELRERLPLGDWEKFYQEVLDLECDFSDVAIPEKQEGFDRLLIMAQGLTFEQLLAKTRSVDRGELYGEFDMAAMFNSIYSDRTTKTAYAIWVRDSQEPDKELTGLSSEQIKDQKLATETFEERLLHGLKYLKETGQNLDVNTITLCNGSQFKSGVVPGIYYNNINGGTYINSYVARNRGILLGARAVIV
ncbi:MAG: hypothetical protein WCW02_02345 [Candidatus Buchananbacteria bacterium]